MHRTVCVLCRSILVQIDARLASLQLRSAARVNSQDDFDVTPLTYAVQNNDPRFVDLTLSICLNCIIWGDPPDVPKSFNQGMYLKLWVDPSCMI